MNAPDAAPRADAEGVEPDPAAASRRWHAMSAWDEAVRDALRETCAEFVDTWRMGPTEASDMLLAALAPHLTTRDAAVRREALEEAATLADKYHDLPEWAHGTELDAGEAIRALATDATQ